MSQSKEEWYFTELKKLYNPDEVIEREPSIVVQQLDEKFAKQIRDRKQSGAKEGEKKEKEIEAKKKEYEAKEKEFEEALQASKKIRAELTQIGAELKHVGLKTESDIEALNAANLQEIKEKLAIIRDAEEFDELLYDLNDEVADTDGRTWKREDFAPGVTPKPTAPVQQTPKIQADNKCSDDVLEKGSGFERVKTSAEPHPGRSASLDFCELQSPCDKDDSKDTEKDAEKDAENGDTMEDSDTSSKEISKKRPLSTPEPADNPKRTNTYNRLYLGSVSRSPTPEFTIKEMTAPVPSTTKVETNPIKPELQYKFPYIFVPSKGPVCDSGLAELTGIVDSLECEHAKVRADRTGYFVVFRRSGKGEIKMQEFKDLSDDFSAYQSDLANMEIVYWRQN